GAGRAGALAADGGRGSGAPLAPRRRDVRRGHRTAARGFRAARPGPGDALGHPPAGIPGGGLGGSAVMAGRTVECGGLGAGVAAGPALVGPLLPHLSRPERALEAVLLVNPATAVGAALGMDVLRSPRLYMLTRAPEYWYTYPPAAAVAMVYLTVAAAGGYHLR